MIFVTVGTHEQQFNRLIETMDKWAKMNDEEVIMQIGYSTYESKYCKWQKFFSYQEMIENVKKARIVITHGGPSSFIMPLQQGKIPIVVPRQYIYGEHINNHQFEFVKEVSNRYRNIIWLDDVANLGKTIENYDSISKENDRSIGTNNVLFCNKLINIVKGLVGK